ncbi:MAG: putative metal-binding motif-containing protein [Polyangiaceae bacterium]
MLRGLGKGWRWGVLSVSGVFLHSACSSDEADAIRRAKLAEGCLINSDCSQSPDQLICAFQRCHIQCNSSADCDTGLRCVLGTKPEHVCLLKEEQDCKLSSDCPDPLVCGPDGECRDQCKTNSDCVEGQECTDHMCADSAELVNGRLPDKLSDGGADTGSPPPGVGFPCEYNSDCQGTLVCKGGSCKEECKADTDCSPGIQCDPATHRCLPKTSDAGADTSTDVGPDVSLDGGSPCKLNSDCAAPLVCRFGTCEPECKADVDCTNGKHCVNQSCVYSAPDGAPPGYGTPCTHTSQCSSGLVCVPGGVCAYECLNSGDCDMAAGFCCLSHFCLKGGASCNPDGGSGGSGGTGGTGGSGGTGGADAGKSCTTNAECSDNVVCNGVELCVGGHCAPPGPVCDDQNPCTTDACNASTGQCEHTATVTPVDQDNDGHYAIACGSGADDCDDKNPKVFAGAPELCDQLDNNCNGYVDEALWKAQPVTTLATASYYQGKQIFDNVPGGPAIIRMGDGSFRVLAVANDTSVGAIRGYKLDAALTLQGSATDLATGPDAVWVSVTATDGTGFLAFGTTRYDTPTTSQTATVFRTDGLSALRSALRSPR